MKQKLVSRIEIMLDIDTKSYNVRWSFPKEVKINAMRTGVGKKMSNVKNTIIGIMNTLINAETEVDNEGI